MPIHPDFPFPLYLVISENDCKEVHWLTLAEEAILGGVDIMQLREKNCSKSEFRNKAIALKKITDKYQIPLVINDAIEIASDVEAWGIHVGLSDTQPLDIVDTYAHRFHIGWSLEYAEQLDAEQMQVTHHLGISPVFDTPTKTNTVKPWGIDGIHSISELTNKPLIAIGGMNISNAHLAFENGANSIAVVSAICASKDPRKAAQQLKQAIHDVK